MENEEKEERKKTKSPTKPILGKRKGQTKEKKVSPQKKQKK